MAAAVDTCILVHAASAPPSKSSKYFDEQTQKRIDCKAVCAAQSELCIPAPVLVEFVPYLRGQERVAFDEFLSKASILPFGTDAAMLAAKLVRDARGGPLICPACFNPIGSTPCKKCGSVSSRAQGLVDYMVAASAAVAPHVETLYTYDIRRDIVEALRDQVMIVEPPSTMGPLFAYLAEIEKNEK